MDKLFLIDAYALIYRSYYALIKNPRIVFTPSKEFRESVLNRLQFQNAGVLDEVSAMLP